MFLNFELNHRLRRPLIYVFFIVNFLLVFGATVSENVTIGISNTAVFPNAPQTIIVTILFMSLFGLFMTTAIVSSTFLREKAFNFEEITFTTPIQKISYVFGKFFAVVLLSLLPYVGMLLGIFIGSVVGNNGADIAVHQFAPYAVAFFCVAVPNTVFVAAIITALALTYRSQLICFLGAVVLLVAYLVSISLFSDLSNEYLVIFSDPFGLKTYQLLTKYWTVEEMNSKWLSWKSDFLLNRAIWLVASFLIFAVSYVKFSFRLQGRRHKKITATESVSHELLPLFQFPVSQGIGVKWQQLAAMLQENILSIIKGVPFIILLLLGYANTFSMMSVAGKRYGTGNEPLTYLMIESIQNSFNIFLLIILMFYAGQLVWRARESKFDDLLNTTSTHYGLRFLSQIFSLILLTIGILVGAIGIAVFSQIMQGGTAIDHGQYAQAILGYDLLSYTMYIVLAIFIHTVLNQKYVSYFVFIVVSMGLGLGLQAAGFKSRLLSFGQLPNYTFSDFNRFGAFGNILNWFSLYWVLVVVLMALIGILFVVNGKETSFRNRLRIAGNRWKDSFRLPIIVSAVACLFVGGFIRYNTNIVNEIRGKDWQKINAVAYETAYQKYANLIQPKVVEVNYEIDLFPTENAFEMEAEMFLKNNSAKAISEIHVNVRYEFNQQISLQNADLQLNDTTLNYRIYKLQTPLAPQDSVRMIVQSSYQRNGIENELTNQNIAENGMFLTNRALLPVIGYSRERELTDENDREENGLSKKKTWDSDKRNYLSSDADWIRVTTKISTDKDQIAIAPGELTDEKEENGRKVYQYEMKSPSLHFTNFSSASYAVEKEVWKGENGKEVALEIYYHPTHDYNIKKMMNAMQASMDYYTKNFGSYPLSFLRIIEFPRYGSYAQAFAGTIPFSESMGFIADLKDSSSVDMAFYTVAHEVAHQWWGHQVVGANAPGTRMLTETMAQYSALMVMKSQMDVDKYRLYEMDKYLRNRGKETEKENAISKDEDQPYVHYAKGSVAMFALQNYIGEDVINAVLREFITEHKFNAAPYPTSTDLVNKINAFTPDSLQYLVADLLKKVSLYDNSVTYLQSKKTAENQFENVIDLNICKYEINAEGKQIPQSVNDFVDVELSNEKGEKLLVRKRLSSGSQQIKLTTNFAATKVTVDPNRLLIDRNANDNTFEE